MRAQTKGMHEIRKRSAIGIAAVLAMIVSVVGWATAGTVGAAQTPSCLPTSDRTLGPYDFAGLGIKAAPFHTDALHFAQFQFGGRRLDDPDLVREANALTSEGFVSGISQVYTGPRGQVSPSGTVSGRGSFGYATVIQLGSPEQAQAEMNRNLAKSPRRKRFTVPAIPGSQGLLTGGQSEAMKGVRNAWDGVSNMVSFTDGDYSYAISRLDAFAVNHRRASRGTKQVTKAAINLYNRVHGAAVCP